ncbi:MAG TPA: diacylglycerol kinase family protein [Acidobacteriaceae bacterium]|nr:diacylglycerol kinase family protein [Acidobacteriaceae bacterium]
MRRAVLLFNPNAGRGGAARLPLLHRAAEVLTLAGIDAEIIATRAACSAGQQAADAVAAGADLIFACGGDGTLHDVIQGLAQNLSATVGIIPLGSANALARHFDLSLNPAQAVRQQLQFIPRIVPLGRVTCGTANGTRSRYFAVMAGAGPDGALVYRMLAFGKHRLGRSIYYLRAARLFAGSQFSPFRISLNDAAEQLAVSAMSVRVGDLGGLFSPLVRGASPADEKLRVSITRPPSRLSLPAWFAMSWAHLRRWNPYSQTLDVEHFSCSEGSHRRIHVQADGEWIGHTPMYVEIVPNALRLLMPA